MKNLIASLVGILVFCLALFGFWLGGVDWVTIREPNAGICFFGSLLSGCAGYALTKQEIK